MHRAPVGLADEARGQMEAARALVDQAAENTYGVNTGFGRFVSESISDRPGRRAPAATAAQPRVRRRRAVSAGGRARGDAAAGERAREGVLGRADRDGRAADRMPQPRCPAAGAGPRLGRRERRPRSARSSGAAARRRRARLVRGHAAARAREALAAAGLEPVRLGCEGGPVADQRHAVHGGDGLDRAHARPAAGADGRSRLRALARGAAGLAHELPSGDPSGAAAARAGRLGRQPAPPARGVGDHRVAQLVRPRPGRLLAPVRAAGARSEPRPARRTSRRRSRSS